MNVRNIAPRLESRHEIVKIRRSRGGRGGGGGGGRGGEKLLKRYDVINICPLKNGLCPSKNSFDRII